MSFITILYKLNKKKFKNKCYLKISQLFIFRHVNFECIILRVLGVGAYKFLC